MFTHPLSEAHTDHVVNAEAFEYMPDMRHSLIVRDSYDSFARATLNQWEALLPHFQFEPWLTSMDSAYANSREMFFDVNVNRHLWVFRTDESQMDRTHPLSVTVPDSLRIDGMPILNDVFRAVHDMMGHIVSGGSFGVNGEMKAWIAHRDYYPREALSALWCETRGQAAWTNAWGNHAELPLPLRPFAEQKAGIAPEWLV